MSWPKSSGKDLTELTLILTICLMLLIHSTDTLKCLNIYKTAVVQKRRVETYEMVGQEGSNLLFTEPRVHAFVYEPSTGQITKLPVDFKQYLDDLRPLYDLYTPAEPEVVHPITLNDG
jgi:hypothetical protein